MDKLTVGQFGAEVKKKYPQYATLSDLELGQRMLQKYPTYSERVSVTPASLQFKQTPTPQATSMLSSSPQDTGFSAGLKAIANTPKSAFNLAKDIGTAVINPIDTLKGISKVGAGAVEKLIPGKQASEANFDQLGGYLKQRYGSLESLQKTATEDPFSFGADLLGVITGGASLVGKAGTVGKAIGTAGRITTSPVTKTLEGTAETIKNTTRYGISQATGLSPESINQLLQNPSAFKGVTPEIRAQTANAVKDALDMRIQELSDTGAGYQVIKETPGSVVIPEGTIQSVLDKYGVKLDAEGKITTSPESRPLSPGDKTALQSFLDNYGTQPVLSNNAFLNTREALSQLAKYDQTKTGLSTNIARELRAAYDAQGKAQIKGLKELDSAYAPEKQLLDSVKSKILAPDGTLKDNAVSTIANLNGKGKEKLLERMKEIVPDIEQRVKVIKAVEDIENVRGQKVGTYARAGLQLGGLGLGITTGNIPLIIGAIMATPEIAVPLLRGAGLVGEKAKPILNAIKAAANDVNNFTLPAPILNYSENPKLGASVVNIARNIHPEDQALMEKFIDSARVKGAKLTDSEFTGASRLAEKFGISMDKGLAGVANMFEKILTGEKKVVGTAIPGSVKKK